MKWRKMTSADADLYEYWEEGWEISTGHTLDGVPIEFTRGYSKDKAPKDTAGFVCITIEFGDPRCTDDMLHTEWYYMQCDDFHALDSFPNDKLEWHFHEFRPDSDAISEKGWYLA